MRERRIGTETGEIGMRRNNEKEKGEKDRKETDYRGRQRRNGQVRKESWRRQR